MIVQDMVDAFKNPQALLKVVHLKAVNERGEDEEAEDVGGVFRDLLSAFWTDFLRGHSVGEIEVVPCIRHDFGFEEWRSVARIIIKGLREVDYFPIKISKAFMTSCVFGESAVAEDVLLESFYNYLPADDAVVLKTSVEKETINVYGDDEDVLDILTSLFSKRIISTGPDLKLLLIELSHKEIIQAAAYIREAWEDVFSSDQLVHTVLEFNILYARCKPTNKKVLQLLDADVKSDLERESLQHLKKFVRSLPYDNLKKFLRYTTGADILCVEHINIMFTHISAGLNRRIIAHTCGPTLELPTTYECYAEFKEEFLNILSSGYWSMDFA